MDRHFGCRGLVDLFTWKRGSKWTKSSIVEFLAGEKSGFYINAILDPQVTGLHLFRFHPEIPRQTSTTEKIVHFCRFLMQTPVGLPLKGWISLLFFMQTPVGLPLKGWISLLLPAQIPEAVDFVVFCDPNLAFLPDFYRIGGAEKSWRC